MRWLFAPMLALSLLIWAAAPTSAGEHPPGPRIWFTPNPNANSDFGNLWSDTAPWQNAARKVDVLGIVHEWLLTATDQQILAMVNFAQEHHMKLDLEVEAITQSDPQDCPHIEGFVNSATFPTELATLKRLNVHIDILNMDGPLWNGHYNTIPSSCAVSVSDLVTNVAATLAPIVAQYPDIQVYEIEPVPGFTGFSDWQESLNDFEVGLSTALARPVRGLFLDVTWDTPTWVQPLLAMRQYTQQRNMQFGWFFDATQYARSDAQWLASAAQLFEYVEGTMGIIPDNGIFASWNLYPANNMPDTWPGGGLTSLINEYFRERTTITAQFVGQGAQGKLTTRHDGKPVANATINGYEPGVDFSQPMPTTVIHDVVPQNAAYGLIGYRLNAECLCQGVNDVLVGPLTYQETSGGSASNTYLLPNLDQNYGGVIVTNETVGGMRVNRVITTATQTFLPNSAFFPVTPGATFTYTIPAATMGHGPWYGHVQLMLFDSNYNVVGVPYVDVPSGGEVLLSSATTGIDGSFVLPKMFRVGPGSAPVTIEYPGDATHRPVAWSPLQ
jgi:hypothetical protein